MSGFYGLLNFPEKHKNNFYEKFFSYNKFASIHEERVSGNLIYGRNILPKFKDDKVFYEDENIIIVLDGILYGYDNLQSFIKTEYLKSGLSFLNNLEGNFSGFIFDKNKDQLHLFTDLLATRSLYYYIDKESHLFIFGSELKVLTSILKEQKKPIKPDKNGFKCLLSLGYMLDDITMVQQIRRLPNAATLTYSIKNGEPEISSYFSFEPRESQITKKEAVETIDQLLIKSVESEWNRDKKESNESLSFISGGLDARVNLLLAKELGYKNITCLNFSQTGADDHTIAKEIATGEQLKYIFYPLDEGNYLLDHFSEFVAANDGMVVLHGAAHMYQALKSIDLSEYGAVHSGQIGDVLFGSFSRANFDLKKDFGKMGFINDEKLLSEITCLPKIIDRYENSLEQFSYEQRQVNGTLNGDRMCSHIINLQSPFYAKDLVKFCLALPKSFKTDKYIYTEWIRSKHPHFFNYRWDKAGIVPKNKFFTKIALKYKRFSGYVSRLLGNPQYSMNPFEKWFEMNQILRAQLDSIFQEEIGTVSENWLKNDIERIYTVHGVNGKLAAITALLAYKLHFK